jgi:Icc-related predicted phosphoesterase
VIIGAGDFANERTGVSTCIDILKAIQIPAVLVAGNNESYDELVAACANWQSARVLHGAGVEIDGVPFFGIGGHIHTSGGKRTQIGDTTIINAGSCGMLFDLQNKSQA